MAHSVRAMVAILSAVCIWVAAILQALQFFNATGGTAPTFDRDYGNKLRSLDPATLRSYWEYRRSQLGIDFIIDLLAALGLAGVAWCVVILKKIFRNYKGGHSDLPGFMVGCFAIGAIIPALQFLNSIGYTTAADIITRSDQLPDVGIQAVHIAYNVARGGTFYLFSVQFICVSVGLILSSIMTFSTLELPKPHAIVGFITAAFGILTFIFEIVTFNAGNRGTGITLGVFVLLYGIIFLPIWVVWLGSELKKMKRTQARAKAMDRNLVGEGASEDHVQMENIKE